MNKNHTNTYGGGRTSISIVQNMMLGTHAHLNQKSRTQRSIQPFKLRPTFRCCFAFMYMSISATVRAKPKCALKTQPNNKTRVMWRFSAPARRRSRCAWAKAKVRVQCQYLSETNQVKVRGVWWQANDRTKTPTTHQQPKRVHSRASWPSLPRRVWLCVSQHRTPSALLSLYFLQHATHQFRAIHLCDFSPSQGKAPFVHVRPKKKEITLKWPAKTIK